MTDPDAESTKARDPGVARLRVELRVLGALGLAYNFAFGHAALWAFATLGIGGRLSEVPWTILLVPYLIGALVLGVSLLSDLPTLRWPRSGSEIGPTPLPLLLGGFPMTLLAPVFKRRHDRARKADPPQSAHVEAAFMQLLKLPRTIGLRYLVCVAIVLLVHAVVMGTHAAWPRDGVIAITILWIALAGPVTALLIGWVRAIIRPVYLSAPRSQSGFRRTADLKVRLSVNAGIATAGLVLAPLCVGYLWITSHRSVDPRARAGLVAERMLNLAHDDRLAELGRLLGENPRATVWVGDRVFGLVGEGPPKQSGLLDTNADGVADVLILHSNDVVVRAQLPPPREPIPPPLALGALAAMLASLGAIVLLARDVERDVTRAAQQAEAVASGEAPSPLTEDTFATAELRELVGTVDRLVKRITDANVTKYVAIEKAKEADRLKSQFLANMSHDLRSPLISILGFSELLLTGIDGDLTNEQKGMVEPIHDSGRSLLQQIDDILDTAKIEAGRLDLHPEPTPPATLINRAIHSAKKRRDHVVEYVVDVAPGLPPAFVDPYRTVQAIENVLLFASERVEGGEVHVSVHIDRSDRGRMISVDVETPVAPATAEQLTRARRGFFRIPGHRGLGLGLPIAGAILELEGGSLDIEERGEGMLFSLKMVSPEVRREPRFREVSSR
jgi:signal transduction histidine kinase